MHGRRESRRIDKQALREAKRQARRIDKPYRRQRNSAITAVIIFVIFFVFAASHIGHILFNHFTTEPIPLTTITLSGNGTPQLFEGIIIRDETVYTAPVSGVVEYYVNSFVRLRPYTVAASIQQYEIMQNLRPRMMTHEREQRRLSELSGYMNDPAIRHADAQIGHLINSRLSRNIRTNMPEIHSLVDGINQNIANRNQVIMTAGTSSELDDRGRFLEEQLAVGRTELQISGGGIISPIVDGFEELLTPENMYSLTAAQTRADPGYEPQQRREVEEGAPVFKIVGSNMWYIAAHIPAESAESLRPGQRRLLYIEGTPAPLQVYVHSTEPSHDETLVIFRTNNFMTDFLENRRISFRIPSEHAPALQIPTTAIETRRYLSIPREFLHGHDPHYYVKRVFGVEYETIPVTAAISTDDYIYIDAQFALRPGDTLQNGDAHFTVEAPREVEGVFRVIYGRSSFSTIYREEEPGTLYTVLDPAQNPDLRENSLIVTYAGMVEDMQIVVRSVR